TWPQVIWTWSSVSRSISRRRASIPSSGRSARTSRRKRRARQRRNDRPFCSIRSRRILEQRVGDGDGPMQRLFAAPPARRGAFTLIELLVVIAIIGVLV